MQTDFKITAPVLDMNVIQKAAQDAAMKAALEEVKDYYLGYNSPYRKQLKEYMAKNAPSTSLELPEFSELLSKSLITAPVLDMNVIQKAAQDAAMKAALEEVKDYYLGYNSPYRKQLKEYMAKNAPSTSLELPKFSELLSKSLTAEIENFVNKKCVESFAQELRKGFTHLKEEGDGTILLTNLAEDMMKKVDLEDVDSNYSILGLPTKNSDENYHFDTINVQNRKCTISFQMFSGVSNDHILLVLARCIMFDALDSNYIIKKSNEFEDY